MKIVEVFMTAAMGGCQYLFHKTNYLYVILAFEAVDPGFHCAVKKAMTSSLFSVKIKAACHLLE